MTCARCALSAEEQGLQDVLASRCMTCDAAAIPTVSRHRVASNRCAGLTLQLAHGEQLVEQPFRVNCCVASLHLSLICVGCVLNRKRACGTLHRVMMATLARAVAGLGHGPIDGDDVFFCIITAIMHAMWYCFAVLVPQVLTTPCCRTTLATTNAGGRVLQVIDQ